MPVTIEPPSEPAARARLLLVDDTLANLVALTAVLEPLGQELVTARSGEEALRRLLEMDFAAILLDVQMPGLDGIRTAELIRQRERCRTTPIIFLTAYASPGPKVFEGYAHGAADFLVKPYDPEVLRAKVRVLVDLHLARERVRREGEMTRRRERLDLEHASAIRQQRLIDSLPHAVWVARIDGAVESVNAHWLTTTGMDLAETRRRGVILAVHGDDRAAFSEKWSKAARGSEPFELECRLTTHDGTSRWCLVRCVPELDAQRRVSAWICTATDVDALRAASRAKDEFIAAAAHELRTPLAAAKVQAQVAGRKIRARFGEDADDFTHGIVRQIDRLTRLVDDLLEVGRLGAGALVLRRRKFDLAEHLRQWCTEAQMQSDRHKIDVATHGPLVVDGDPDRIEQVVVNLIHNAIRYSPDGGDIHVRAEDRTDKTLVTVRDRGIGIPAERQHTIFDPFAQITPGFAGGVGLGLAISRGIVERHGGKIWVESPGEHGEGSVFFVELPRRSEQVTIPAVPAARAS